MTLTTTRVEAHTLKQMSNVIGVMKKVNSKANWKDETEVTKRQMSLK